MCLTTDFTPHGSTLLHHAARCEARIDVQEMKSLQHAPSKVAAAAVGLALRINHLPPWSAALRKYSRYTEESLAPVQQVCLYAHTHPPLRRCSARVRFPRGSLRGARRRWPSADE